MLVFNKALSTEERSIVNAYLSHKWGLSSSIDSDGDGFTDAVEIAVGSLATDATSTPYPDFSKTVGAVINADDSDATGLAGVESNLALWLDASNINNRDNAGLSNGDALSTWMDLSGNGNNATAVDASKVTLTENSSIFNNESVIAFNEEGFTLANTVNPKNLFIVYKRTSKPVSVPGYSGTHNYPRFFVGHSSTTDFHSGWHTYGAWDSIWSTITDSDILNGTTYQNGAVVNGQSATFTDTGELLSVQLAGTGAEFNQIGKDRGSSTAAQNWLGDIAEIIVFDGDLTGPQRWQSMFI